MSPLFLAHFPHPNLQREWLLNDGAKQEMRVRVRVADSVLQ